MPDAPRVVSVRAGCNDGADYTMLLAAQWFEDVELIMAPVCRTSDYGAHADEVDAFVGALSVERV